LPTAEISRQRLELEEAIRRVEREAAAAPKAVIQPRAAAAGGARSAPASKAQPEARGKQSPQDVFRRAIQEAESNDDVRPVPARAPVAARADDWSIDEQEDTQVERAQPVAVPQPAVARQARAERALPAARPTESYLPSQGYVEEKPAPDEPRLAPDYDYEWDPDAAPRPAIASRSSQLAPDVDPSDRYAPRTQRGRRRPVREEEDDDVDAMERRARPSSLPTILLIVLILIMLAGLGALAWYERAVIADLLGGFDSHQAQAVKPAAAPVSNAGSKDSESLLGNGQAAPASPDIGVAPSDDVRVVTPGADNSAAAPAAAAVSTAPSSAAGVTASAGALVAQKATLYEEPVDPSAAQNGVVAINAAVTWSAAQAADGPEIVGQLDIPDRGMKIKLTFRINHDKTLPASHVVEVQLTVPPNFPGKGIRDVPRLVAKAGEDVRGQPLVGASAKVADGYFWIGLSGVDADLATNLALLKQREWFDLPLVYESGQRAILTFEKGTTGDRVFDQVLSAWAGG
jgi:hypothetical protein